MIALVKFTGIIGGKEKVFAAGDKITAKEAEEMGLADKPHLAKPAKADKE